MKKIFSIAMTMIAAVCPLHAEIETTVGADIVSRYIWRGCDLGEVAIQPTLGVSAAGFDLTFWGSTGIVNWTDTKEFDITLSYSVAGLSVGVTDYWFNVGPEPYGRYFKYAKESTNHVFEANIGYDFGHGWTMGSEIEVEHGGTESAIELDADEAGECSDRTEKPLS